MGTKRFLCGLVMAGVVLAAVQVSPAGLITTNLGDRGDGYQLIQISYDGSGNNTGTWTVPAGINSIEVLVVGGGGAGANGGGAFAGSGGGAGGAYYSASWIVVPNSVIDVTVGLGGVATTANDSAGAPGVESRFGSIFAYGGEGGIPGEHAPGRGGNSGGHSIDGGLNITPGFLGGTGSGAKGGAGASQDGRDGGYSSAYGGAGLLDPVTGNIGVVDANGNPIVGFYGQMIGFAGGGSAGFDGHELGAQYGESYGGGSGSEPESFPGLPGFHLTGGGGGGGRNNKGGGGGGHGVIYVAFIPEPTSALLLLTGLAGLLLIRRRR